jgi:hypothetical protein
MTLLSEYGGDFELPPEGKHSARLVKFVDMGAQPGKFGTSRQAELAFEIIGQTTEHGDPMLAFKRIFNLSPRSKNFRDVVRALTGLHDIAAVETATLVGLSCELLVEHVTNEDGNEFANCEVRALKNSKSLDDAVTPKLFFSLHPMEFDAKAVSTLSERQQEKVRESATYKELVATAKHVRKSVGKPAAAIIDDDFPANL